MKIREIGYRTEGAHRLIRAGVMTYVLALGLIAAFSVGFHLLTGRIVDQQQDTARIVNLSGRQRMLSQRIARLAIERAGHMHFRSDAETDKALGQAITEMEAGQRTLMDGLAKGAPKPLSDAAVRNIFVGEPVHLDVQVSRFLEHARAVAVVPAAQLTVGDPDVRALEGAVQGPFLEALNGAVQAISDSSERSIQHLHRLMASLTALMLALLLAEALFLYRPLFRKLERATRELAQAGATDPLTGCLNRRAFVTQSQRVLDEAQASSQDVCVMMIDLDRFKSINDRYGHPVGDAVINAAVKAMLGCTRQGNLLCRMGGEEFAVVLVGSTLQAAGKAAEQLRAEVENSSVELETGAADSTVQVTVSIGVAMLRPGDQSVFQVLHRADRALYRAKQNGRNRVELEQFETDNAGATPSVLRSSRDKVVVFRPRSGSGRSA